MLKLNMKQIKTQSCKYIREFLENNFFQLKTSDVIQLRQLYQSKLDELEKDADKWVESFSCSDKKTTISLALLQMKRVYGEDITMQDVWLGPEEYYKAFWKFARKIADYRNNQKLGTARINKRWAKRKNLTAYKKRGILKG